VNDAGAAGQVATLAGEAGADAAAAPDGLDGLTRLAGVAASTLFGVAAIIGVVEVAARQWAVAKAKNGQRSPRGDESARHRKSNRGPSGTHDYSRESQLGAASL
jgi:hypothetical protein